MEDLAWHIKNENLFGSVGQNKYLQLWDVRAPSMSNPIQYCVAHPDTENCLSFNPLNEWSVITGSSYKTVKIWDTRKISKSNDLYNCVHAFKQHTGKVFQVGWNPHNKMVFASGCHGRKVLLWDINKIGDIQNGENVKNGPPELPFFSEWSYKKNN